MCEFRVTLDGIEIMNEVVYALEENDSVTISNIIGEIKTLQRARIKEVNVLKTSLTLETY